MREYKGPMVQLRLIKGGKYHQPPEPQSEPLFFEGQVVTHRLFDYRGVIVGVDRMFQGTEDWYDRVARSRPPRITHGTKSWWTRPATRPMSPNGIWFLKTIQDPFATHC